MALVALVTMCAAWSGGAAAAAPARPFLWQCEQIHLDQAKDACYLRLLLEDINRSGSPATELPRIDRLAKAAGTALYGRCHLLMHTVGREWAAEHHLTIEQLQNVEPRSNDPGCSAGFGMGLVMYLGPKIISTGGKSVIPECNALPTSYRQFTCVHSLGHALMRGYHEALFLAVQACARLGARYAPDCEQGAFHDYWVSLRGADDTMSPMEVVRSPRKLCAQYSRWAVECWYRYFIEQSPGPIVQSVRDLTSLCSGLAGVAAHRLHRRRGEGRHRRSRRADAALRGAAHGQRRACLSARRREPGLCRDSRRSNSRSSACVHECRQVPAAGATRGSGGRSTS